MKEIFKKYAFVFIAAIFFTALIIAYTANYFSQQTPSKTVDGQDVVFSVNGTNITADELFAEYESSYADNALLNAFSNAIVDEYEETTDEMREEAETNANSVLLYYQSYYGSSYQDYILEALVSMGYDSIDDLTDYFIRMEKYYDLVDDYLLANPTTEMTEYQNLQGRVVSHILVSMDDPDNPTDEELEKVEAIETALQNGEDFADVAIEYSDDSSASSGGLLGAINSETEYVEEFLEAALALNAGEITTDWVKTDYGWHLIKCDSTDMADILDNGLRDDILDADSSIAYTAMWEAAQTIGVTFADEETEAMIKENFGITDETTEETTEETTDETTDESSDTTDETTDSTTDESSDTADDTSDAEATAEATEDTSTDDSAAE